jgi:hypothetical protein
MEMFRWLAKLENEALRGSFSDGKGPRTD